MKIYGLVGYPVKHSLSPAMHNAAFKSSGIDAEYRLFEVHPDDLEDFITRQVLEMGIAGFNVTVPHKVAAWRIIERVWGSTEYARRIEAINTVRVDGETLTATNTDAPGFARSLNEDTGFIIDQNKTALVIGCGGAGRAVATALSIEKGGVGRMYLSDVRQESVVSLAQLFPGSVSVALDDLASVIDSCDLLVDTTPVGMESDDIALNPDLLHGRLTVYDVVYNRETRLVREARQRGLAVAGGLGMLLYQGVAAWELWTGREAPVGVMREALINAMKTG
jgi:shikimate dehydrogenase